MFIFLKNTSHEEENAAISCSYSSQGTNEVKVVLLSPGQNSLASSCLQAHLLNPNLQFLIWPEFCPFTSQQNLILYLHSQPWPFLWPQQLLLPYIWFRFIMLSIHTLDTFSQPISKPLKLCCVLSNLYLLYLFCKPYR